MFLGKNWKLRLSKCFLDKVSLEVVFEDYLVRKQTSFPRLRY